MGSNSSILILVCVAKSVHLKFYYYNITIMEIYEVYFSNLFLIIRYYVMNCFLLMQVLEKYRGSAREKSQSQVVGEKRSILIEEEIDEDNRLFKKVVFISESGVKFDEFTSKSATNNYFQATNPRDVNKDSQRRLQSSKKHIKYAISNTGRLAYGTIEEVREIYKLHDENISASNKAKSPGPHNPATVLSKNMSNLSVSTNSAKLPPQQVGVGVSGRAAAMSRMKALGEEWAEEEDLPIAGPASHLLSGSGGGVSKAVTKETQNSKQRQGQRSSAKSKY